MNIVKGILQNSILKKQIYYRRIKFKPHIKLWTQDEIEQYRKQNRHDKNEDQLLKQDDEEFNKLAKGFFRTQKKYQKIQNDWKDNLISKQKKRERKLERDLQRQPRQNEEPKLIIHSSNYKQIQLNEDLFYDSFAIINIKGFQYKIVEDDLLRIQKLDGFKIGDLIEIENILLIGRPNINFAKVYLRVEEQTRLSQLTVFKKRRRKGYQKTIGHYMRYTALRVEKILYDIPEQIQNKAIRLISDQLNQINLLQCLSNNKINLIIIFIHHILIKVYQIKINFYTQNQNQIQIIIQMKKKFIKYVIKQSKIIH